MSDRAIPWHTSFVGQGMQHNYWLYAIVDRIMTANGQIRSIVEIGTGAGALTMVLGLWGIKRSLPVLTIDKEMRHDRKLLDHLRVKYLQADEWSEQAAEAIRRTIGRQPTLLMCDGGCKSKELQTYSKYASPGSIVTAHDLGAEFNHEIDAEQLCPFVLEKYQENWWMEANVQLAIYRRV
jgi:hypothetical protein